MDLSYQISNVWALRDAFFELSFAARAAILATTGDPTELTPDVFGAMLKDEQRRLQIAKETGLSGDDKKTGGSTGPAAKIQFAGRSYTERWK